MTVIHSEEPAKKQSLTAWMNETPSTMVTRLELSKEHFHILGIGKEVYRLIVLNPRISPNEIVNILHPRIEDRLTKEQLLSRVRNASNRLQKQGKVMWAHNWCNWKKEGGPRLIATQMVAVAS